MSYIDHLDSGSIQAGDALVPPTSTVDLWPSLDPTKPFSAQNWGVSNFVGAHNQIGLYNGIGIWNELGTYNGIGQGIFLGGHTDAQPFYDSSSPSINYNSPDGDLNGFWKYNGSSICAPCPSDRRAKTNIIELSGSLDKVLSLRGVSFEWNADVVPNKASIQSSSIGLIAQEVEEIIPEVVVTERIENQDLKTVEYGNLTALLIEAIKEQQSQIETLTGTVQELSKRLDQHLL